MKHVVPLSAASCSTTSIFLIGRNSRGNWIVQDRQGVRGGLFVARAEALKFAMFENGNQPQAVVMVPGVLELDMGVKVTTPGLAGAAVQMAPCSAHYPR